MHRTMSSFRRFIPCLVLALALGCRSGGASPSSEGANTTTTIDIENQDFNDMTVYVLVNGARTRLGIAPGPCGYPLKDMVAIVEPVQPARGEVGVIHFKDGRAPEMRRLVTELWLNIFDGRYGQGSVIVEKTVGVGVDEFKTADIVKVDRLHSIVAT